MFEHVFAFCKKKKLLEVLPNYTEISRKTASRLERKPCESATSLPCGKATQRVS
jgi:hypothetical protein